MTDDIKTTTPATTPAPAAEPVQQLTVFGTNPQEMAQGQTVLIDWCDRKIAAEQDLLDDAERNVDIARRSKWQVKPWQRRVTLARQQVDYYTRMKSALEAGYWLMPPMHADMFAVRTKRQAPKYRTSNSSWEGFVQSSERLPAGEGRYVSDVPVIYQQAHKNSEGKERKTYWPQAFRDVAFPLTVVRPEIIEATSRAMALKVFDEIGILPQNARRGRDPIVVGRLRRPGSQWDGALFFIAWWLDIDML